MSHLSFHDGWRTWHITKKKSQSCHHWWGQISMSQTDHLLNTGPGQTLVKHWTKLRSNMVPFFSQLLGIIGGVLAGEIRDPRGLETAWLFGLRFHDGSNEVISRIISTNHRKGSRVNLESSRFWLWWPIFFHNGIRKFPVKHPAMTWEFLTSWLHELWTWIYIVTQDRESRGIYHASIILVQLLNDVSVGLLGPETVARKRMVCGLLRSCLGLFLGHPRNTWNPLKRALAWEWLSMWFNQWQVHTMAGSRCLSSLRDAIPILVYSTDQEIFMLCPLGSTVLRIDFPTDRKSVV